MTCSTWFRAGIGGKSVSTLIDGVRRYETQVWLPPEFRNSIEAVSAIPIRTAGGAWYRCHGSPRLDEPGYSLRTSRTIAALFGPATGCEGARCGRLCAHEAEAKTQLKLPAGY